MYEIFYGLKINPFALSPDPDFILSTKKHRTAMILLEYATLKGAPFCVLTGEIGTGKTTLIQNLVNQLERNITVGLITNTHSSIGELLQWVLMSFKLPYQGKEKVALYQTLVDFLRQEYEKNRHTVLIIDEAQNLGLETLEELRMLSNINLGKEQILQIILIGQPGLRELLKDPKLEQFAQRIAIDYHLEPLTQEETETYIHHRLKVAGAEKPAIFTPSACNAVYQYSGGVPRLINLLCDLALVYGFAEDAETIEADIIHAVARDRQQCGLLPLKLVNKFHLV